MRVCAYRVAIVQAAIAIAGHLRLFGENQWEPTHIHASQVDKIPPTSGYQRDVATLAPYFGATLSNRALA